MVFITGKHEECRTCGSLVLPDGRCCNCGRKKGPMRIKLDKLVATEVEVEMPDACPHCGADWRGEVVEEQMICASETCHEFVCQSPVDGLMVFREESDGEDCRDAGYYVTGYTCAACHCTIVSTEAQAPANDQQEKIQGV